MQIPQCINSQEKETEPISADNLGTTLSPLIVAEGKFQIEIGGSYWRRFYESTFYIPETQSEGSKINYHTYIFSPAVKVRYGLLKFAELRLGIQFNQYLTESKYGREYYNPCIQRSNCSHLYAWGPIQAGVKIKFLKNSKFIPASAFIADFAIPWGDYYSHMDKVSPDIKLAFLNKLPAGFSFKYNFGYLWNIYDSFTEEMGSYSAVLNYDLFPGITIGAESFGLFEPGRTPRLYAGGGFNYHAAQNIMFDLSGRGGLTDRASNYSFSLGVSLRLPE
jgi:hypothetical protein